ncbi:LysR substrate-binding domain-containing protein [Pelagicoccus sp. SDUM812002]|uniref:LysR family transcriptional regulator n=1 Tax=Pelagicoccus sp. SDUM812002 TaxID=3041266 RepID=UPI00280CF001|nr:LysR substrate-binding domain-containing protein [Pelagicoccus sp. SDUM812002]MDQ8188121.1 LysR substrate-binding domain-containing protein [Pelagicoccus sp. SDUM812002]
MPEHNFRACSLRMELRHLRYFIEVALEENVTRAAEKLHVSQPALSRQVKDLEEELGFLLLERSAKSVALTEAGRVFLEEASSVLERLDEGVERARRVAESSGGELHVGYAPSLTVKLLPPTIRAFQAKFPKVKVKLHDMSSEEMLGGLRSGTLSFALMLEGKSRSAGGCQFKPLRKEAIRLAVGRGHAFLGRAQVSVADLKGESLIGFSKEEYPEYGDMVGRLLKAANLRKKLTEEHESVSSLVAAVEAGMGVSVVTESLRCLVGDRVQLLELDPAPESLVVGIAWKERKLTSAERSFVELAVLAAKEEGE